MIVGCDVGGTKALALALDHDSGTVLARARAASSPSGERLDDTIVRLAEELAAESGETVDAVGLGIAGLVDSDGTVRYSPNLPDLVDHPIRDHLHDRLGVPVVVANDATTGTWAEVRWGSGRGCDDFAFVALGTGIGTGFVVNGRLLLGAHGFAGEGGHMVIDRDGPEHVTGLRGPWEYFASGNGLGRLGQQAARDGRFPAGLAPAGSAAAVTGQHVAEALAAGDRDAATIFDGFCELVAVGVANLIVILDPDRVALGGGVADIGAPLRDGVEEHLRRLLFGVEHRPAVDLVLADLGSDAGAIGAGLLAIEAG